MSESSCQKIYKICCCCFKAKKILKNTRVSVDRENMKYNDAISICKSASISSNDKSIDSDYKSIRLDKEIEQLNDENLRLKRKKQEFELQSVSINNYGILHKELDKKDKLIKELEESIKTLEEQLKKNMNYLNQSTNVTGIIKSPSDPLINSGRFSKIKAYSELDQEKQSLDPELKNKIEFLEINLENQKKLKNDFMSNNSKISDDLKKLHSKHIETLENFKKTNELCKIEQEKTKFYIEKIENMTKEAYMRDELKNLLQEQKVLKNNLAEISFQYEECLREIEKYKRGTNENYYKNVINELTQNLDISYW
ncbi:hypothetical protein SteCoe_20293 [Stentor coeruleus]|uniref:Uncharacterized protein n=1 Tax=Stentor coeruleus TaxID=5963 RepID=A0A1R2BSJ2_9CILI|nr:hypothetical protein SteCoe_20293 [Stentor coeruleus]